MQLWIVFIVTKLFFPPQLSDRLDLQHISSGEGLERHLVISKCSPHSAEEGNETRIIPRTDESPADPRTNMLLSNSGGVDVTASLANY